MDCELIRQSIAEDPARRTTEMDLHLAACAPCAAYAGRAATTERRIMAALRFDVGALEQARRGERSPRRGGRRAVLVAIAAASVAGVAVWFGLGGPDPGVRSFAEEVVAHWFEEPDSWIRTDAVVSNVALTSVLEGQARIDISLLGTVTYARSCLVDGQRVPHLVVQGAEGPVMLLLLPGRAVSDSMPLSLPEQRIDGRLLPHGAGSIAILGQDGEPLDEIGRRAVSAVEWTI